MQGDFPCIEDLISRCRGYICYPKSQNDINCENHINYGFNRYFKSEVQFLRVKSYFDRDDYGEVERHHDNKDIPVELESASASEHVLWNLVLRAVMLT
jgi:hypothetical protein